MKRHHLYCKYSGEPFAEISPMDDECGCDLSNKQLKAALKAFLKSGCLCDKEDMPCEHYEAQRRLEVIETHERLKREKKSNLSKAALEDSLQSVRRELAFRLVELQDCRRNVNPPEPAEGQAVKFSVQFSEPGRVYTYGAIRVRDRWYVTGKNFGGLKDGSGTWSQLCDAIRAYSLYHDKRGNGLEFTVSTGWGHLE